MTGIAERKAQWEQQAREDERRLIVEFVDCLIDHLQVSDHSSAGVSFDTLEAIVSDIERGEYRKAKSE